MQMFGISEADIDRMLRESLNVTELKITDLKGGNHWEVEITASDFNGLSLLNRQKLVQKILTEPLANESIHALVIKAKPTE